MDPLDLLIESLSPFDFAQDNVGELTLQARGGVREYWIINPEVTSIEVIEEADETEQLLAAAEPDSALRLHLPWLGELAVEPAAIFPVDIEN